MTIKVNEGPYSLRLSSRQTPLTTLLLSCSALTILAYGYRHLLGLDIAGDFAGMSFIVSLLLLGSWLSTNGASMQIDYTTHSCTMKRYCFGFVVQRSLSLTQIISARCDQLGTRLPNTDSVSQVELVTSEGILTLGEPFTGNMDDLSEVVACVNRYLDNRTHYLSA